MQVSDQGRRTWPVMCQEHLAEEQLQIRRENLPRWGRGSRNKQPTARGAGLQEKWHWEVNASGRKGGEEKGKDIEDEGEAGGGGCQRLAGGRETEVLSSERMGDGTAGCGLKPEGLRARC